MRIRCFQEGLRAQSVKQIRKPDKAFHEIIVHSVVQPVQIDSYEGAFIEADKQRFVLWREGKSCRRGVDIFGYSIKGDLIQRAKEYLALHRAVNMQDSLFAVQGILYERNKAVDRRTEAEVFLNDSVLLCSDADLQQFRNIVKMVVKGIAV